MNVRIEVEDQRREPMNADAGVVEILSSPFAVRRLSVSLVRAASSFMNTSCAVRYSSSPCSVRIRPRAWRWNNETDNSPSSAETWRETADCDRPSRSPAWVNQPASAAAWNTFSLSQSIDLLVPTMVYSAAARWCSCAARNFSASSAAIQPCPAAVTACR